MVDWQPYLEISVPAAAADVDKAVGLAKLPVAPEVKALLTEHQGEAPEPEVVPLPNGGATPFGPVLVVSPTVPDTTNHVYSVSYAMESLGEWAASPDGKSPFFPFASNTASGWFCIDQRDPAQPVVFIDMNYGPNDKGGVTPVAGSVTELLAKLRD